MLVHWSFPRHIRALCHRDSMKALNCFEESKNSVVFSVAQFPFVSLVTFMLLWLMLWKGYFGNVSYGFSAHNRRPWSQRLDRIKQMILLWASLGEARRFSHDLSRFTFINQSSFFPMRKCSIFSSFFVSSESTTFLAPLSLIHNPW